MEISPLLIILGVAGVAFVVLMTVNGRSGQPSPGAAKAPDTVIAGLASIAITGVLGLAWFAGRMLYFDGVMVVELGICAALIAMLGALTAGAFALRRRNRPKTALALLVAAALPVIAVYGFLIYLDSHPIDMR